MSLALDPNDAGNHDLLSFTMLALALVWAILGFLLLVQGPLALELAALLAWDAVAWLPLEELAGSQLLKNLALTVLAFCTIDLVALALELAVGFGSATPASSVPQRVGWTFMPTHGKILLGWQQRGVMSLF